MNLKFRKRALVVLALLAAGLCGEALLYHGLFSGIPKITEFYQTGNSSAQDVTAAELPVIRRESGQSVTGYGTVSAAASVQSGKSQPVDAVYTDNFYPKVYPIRMLAGSFHFTVQPSVIISDKLAGSLFIGLDCIGDHLSLNGKTYTVAGVFKEDNGILAQLSRGREQVFVPLPDNNAKLAVVSFAGGESPEYSLSPLNQTEKAILSGYCPVSLKDEVTLHTLSHTILRNLIFLGLLVILSAFTVRRFRNVIKRIREGMREEYLPGSLKKNRRYLAFHFILGLLGILLFLFCISLLWSPPLPFDFIPDTNLFDWDFYRKAIIARAQLQNCVPFVMCYKNYISLAGNILLWYDFVYLFILACAGWRNRRRLLCRERKSRIERQNM